MQRSAHLVRNLAIAAIVIALVSAGTYVAVTYRPGPSRTGVTALTTFFPVYEHTRNIAGDRITVTLLVPMTLDVHSFDPTPSSIQAVATANLLIYGGAGLEPWIPGLVTAAGNAHLTLVDSSKNLSLLEVPPQFQKEGRTIDPHIWLDPIRAKQQVANILEGLIKADPADATYFTRNAQNYSAKLDLLNSQAINLTANPKTRHFVTFHEAFAYFSMRYNLDQIPIAGPFEEDPTPSEIQGVINATKRYHLCYVGYESLSNPAIAQSIASQTNATLIRLDPIEGLSLEDQTLGKTYLIKMDELLTQLDLMLNHVGCN
ncbi:MAG TPA: zinc ABC transporter substrate-binding protein [Thermoplasmata archaeon]|nr:zinc ABC transporter substrate-binding protein [Thermoplasmata archaeon]